MLLDLFCDFPQMNHFSGVAAPQSRDSLSSVPRFGVDSRKSHLSVTRVVSIAKFQFPGGTLGKLGKILNSFFILLSANALRHTSAAPH
jgi:hypothetical protein